MKKISVLFVCLGNICRSPAAEAIFKAFIKDKGIEENFFVDSAGTGSWHVGQEADIRMRLTAQERQININSRARQINKSDFGKFNYIVTMDNSNFSNVMRLRNSDSNSDLAKIIKIQDYSSVFKEAEVPDPYFGGEEGFEYVLDILEDSVEGFLNSISKDFAVDL